MTKESLKPTHPGRILAEEFMAPIGLTPHRLSKELGVSAPTVNEIVRCRSGISPEMGLLFAAFFGTSESFWINLQAEYDRRQAKAPNGSCHDRAVLRESQRPLAPAAPT